MFNISYKNLMFISWFVEIESILCSAKFSTFLTVVSITIQVLRFNMVPNIGCLCTFVVTIYTLPHTIKIPPHFFSNFFIYTKYLFINRAKVKKHTNFTHQMEYSFAVSKEKHRASISEDLVFVSWLVNIERIFRSAKLVALLAVITLTDSMIDFNVVPDIGSFVTWIATLIALPESIHILQHPVPHTNICRVHKI